MHTIAIISKDMELINQLIKHYQVIILTEENISKHIKANIEILVIEEKIENNKELEVICNQSKYIILQDNVNLNIKLKNNLPIITFGFNHKSTLTVSSVSDEKIIMCIQREIKSLKNRVIEPQEIKIKNNDKYNINRCIIPKIIQEILEK